jgi:hypothetical protein
VVLGYAGYTLTPAVNGTSVNRNTAISINYAIRRLVKILETASAFVMREDLSDMPVSCPFGSFHKVVK